MTMQPFNEKNPTSLSSEILRVLAKESLERGFHGDGLAQAVVDLSRLFTTARATLPLRYLDDPAHAAAYRSYFLPVNLSKIQVLLDELPEDSGMEEPDHSTTVLDLGCGPGTGALALLDWLWQRSPERAKSMSVLAADASHVSLRDTEKLWAAYCREVGISSEDLRCVEGNLEHPLKGELGKQIVRHGPYDLIIMANCLNELFPASVDPPAERAAVVTQLLPFLASHGTIMIVEPALKQTARALHHLRNHVLKQGLCTVYSPCLHEGCCPALDHPDDWCHEERPWQIPPAIAAIDRDVGFIKDALKFSYVLLRTDGRTIATRNRQTFRVVSELRELKGDTRAWLCNELGRSEVGRLVRAQSPTNREWEACQRGSIIRIDGVKRKEGSMLGRIPAEGTVDMIRQV
jgi:ribosomal protein RSM22 (predicted rRNA methylase)